MGIGALADSRGTDGTKASTYERYLEAQAEKVVRVEVVPSLLSLELAERPEGWRSAMVQLSGAEGLSSLSVIELPPRGELPLTRHLYEEYVVALSGAGTVTFHGSNGGSRTCAWGRESVFGIPLNMRHVIRNESAEPARLVRVNNAHLWMDMLGDADAAFHCDLAFPQHEAAVLDHAESTITQQGRRMVFTGPVIHDVGTIELPKHEFIRGPGFGYLLLRLSNGIFGCHVGELPQGHISNAHWHMGGAILISLAGEGYTLSWPSGLGSRPEPEHIRRDDFQYSGAVSVGTGAFHLHANTGRGQLRQVAFRYGGGAGATFTTVQGVEYGPNRVVDLKSLPESIRADYHNQMVKKSIPVA